MKKIKTYLKVRLTAIGLLASIFAIVSVTRAQAQSSSGAGSTILINPISPLPTSIAGDGFLQHITNGTAPFATNGYLIFLPDDATNTCAIIGIDNINGGSGIGYTYTNSNFNTGVALLLLDGGSIDSLTLSFTSLNTGNFDLETLLPAGPFSGGSFVAGFGTAPDSLAGKNLDFAISDGISPFAGTGAFTLAVPASGDIYAITGNAGVSNSAGTYFYAKTNRSTAAMLLNDSVTGSSMVYLGFSDANSGYFAVTKMLNGGFQVGTFTVAANAPGAFFSNEQSLDGNWNYLTGSNGHVFGYYALSAFPYVYHLDMGWLYYFDANNPAHGAYFYDFTDGAFFYTEPDLFPYLYDFKSNTWLYYSPLNGMPDRYTTDPRSFFDFTAHAWINHL